MAKDDLVTRVLQRRPACAKVGVSDIDGIMRGKYVSREKFLSALEKGFGFCDVVLGWDSNDQLYDNVTYTGWHTAYPDAAVRIVPESCAGSCPFEGDMLFFLGEFSGQAEAICPRGTLRRVLEARRRTWAMQVEARPSSSSSSCSRRRRIRCARRAIAT